MMILINFKKNSKILNKGLKTFANRTRNLITIEIRSISTDKACQKSWMRNYLDKLNKRIKNKENLKVLKEKTLSRMIPLKNKIWSIIP